jgi:hypothetical protein
MSGISSPNFRWCSSIRRAPVRVLLLAHRVERRRRLGIIRSQPPRELPEDPGVLFLQRDGERHTSGRVRSLKFRRMDGRAYQTLRVVPVQDPAEPAEDRSLLAPARPRAASPR